MERIELKRNSDGAVICSALLPRKANWKMVATLTIVMYQVGKLNNCKPENLYWELPREYLESISKSEATYIADKGMLMGSPVRWLEVGKA